MTKKQIIDNIKNKKVVIRGAGKAAEKFYLEYRNKLQILYYSTNKKNDCFYDLKKIELQDIIKEKENFFLIVCLEDYETVAFELISEELIPGEHFIFYEIAHALIEKKKILLAVGQCELAVTNYIFKAMPSLMKNYISLYYDEYKILGINNLKPQLQAIVEVDSLIGIADVLIYPVNITNRSNYYNDLVCRVKRDCITVSVPLSTFEGYWPQDNAKDYYENSSYYLQQKFSYFRRDLNVEKAFETNEEKDILERISDENFYSIEYVKTFLEKSIRKFEVYEKRSDIKISDFYRDNYLVKQIFLDRGHAAGFVLKEYARRIIKKCCIDADITEIDTVDLSWYDESHGETPIYPSVFRCLEFRRTRGYRLVSEEITEYLNFEEYLELVYKNVQQGFKYIKGME